jgi:hypothetical protein
MYYIYDDPAISYSTAGVDNYILIGDRIDLFLCDCGPESLPRIILHLKVKIIVEFYRYNNQTQGIRLIGFV